jgi:predicted O-methyltransferase YrrM
MSPRYEIDNKNQNDAELASFVDLLKRENVQSYSEIGSKVGYSLWRVANALRKGSRIVSVDLPHGDRSTQRHLEACRAELENRGYDIRLILGDSTKPDVVESVRKLGPFDACFIDANHTLPYVTADWNNYGPMARIVAFHDIGWIPRPQPSNKIPIEVPQLWKSIKDSYKHEEIRMCERDNGIGVLWRS